MIDPLSVFGTILAIAQMIGLAVSKALENRSQSKNRCLELAVRVKDLADGLHDFPHAAANDKATLSLQGRLKDALDEALRLIDYCTKGGVFSTKYCCRKVTELDNVDKKITKCIMDLMFISQARGHTMSPAVHGNNDQAKGGASSACSVGWPATQDGGSTSQAYYQPPCVGWPSPVMFPGSPPYPAYPARSAVCYAYGCPTSPCPCANFAPMQPRHQHSPVHSSSTIPVLACSKVDADTHSSATSPGTNLEELRMVEEAVLKLLLEDSLASARAEEETRVLEEPLVLADEAAMHRAVQESLALERAEQATLDRVVQESLRLDGVVEESFALARAEHAIVNRVVEESLQLALAEQATLNRVVEESLQLAQAEQAALVAVVEESLPLEAALDQVVEEPVTVRLARAEQAIVNRVVEESFESLRVEDMVRALCAAVNHDHEDNILL